MDFIAELVKTEQMNETTEKLLRGKKTSKICSNTSFEKTKINI